MILAQNRTILATALREYEQRNKQLPLQLNHDAPQHVRRYLVQRAKISEPTRSDNVLVHAYTHCPSCDRERIDEDLLEELILASNEFEHFARLYSELIPKCACGEPKPLTPVRIYAGYPCVAHQCVHNVSEWRTVHAEDHRRIMHVQHLYRTRHSEVSQ